MMPEFLAGAAGLAVAIVGSVLVLVTVCIGLPVWLHHKRRMAEIRGTQAQTIADLQDRLDVMEKKCERLEEQVVECQAQMADEGRELDQRLSQLLTDRSGQ